MRFRTRSTLRSALRSALRSTLIALGLALLASGASALPPFFHKPVTWTSSLVTNDQQAIKDSDFAKLVRQTQLGLNGKRKFTFLAEFSQCFGGGFLTEMGNQGVVGYGTNSASTYFETASYNPPAKNSFYPFAWQSVANVPAGAALPTDEWITWKAYDAIDPTQAAVGAIPKNRNAAFERAQYLSDRVGGVPQALGSAMHNYAIFFVGQPSANMEDFFDVDQLYNLLVGRYGFVAGDIQVLWADKTNPPVPPFPAHAWAPSGKAIWPDLQTAFTNVKNWINGLPEGDSYQVFFFAGDHGNADYPITITVDANATGLPLTGVNNNRVGGFPVGRFIYEAGSGTNVSLLFEQTVGFNLTALSFGDDFQNPANLFRSSYASSSAIVYFGVDNASKGLPGSEVATEVAAGRQPGPDVYILSVNGNRQTFDGKRNLGLIKGAASDELNDFKLRDVQDMLDVNGLPTRPVFFANVRDSRIWVHDPFLGMTYVYYDFNTDYKAPKGPPLRVDALALVGDLMARNGANQLYFDKNRDYMLFSVGRGEVAAPWNGYRPCDIIRLGGGFLDLRWQSCADLGLNAMLDNVDGLDIGPGEYGQPISFDHEEPWPGSPYPNQPYPGDEPTPPYPLPPYNPYP